MEKVSARAGGRRSRPSRVYAHLPAREPCGLEGSPRQPEPNERGEGHASMAILSSFMFNAILTFWVDGCVCSADYLPSATRFPADPRSFSPTEHVRRLDVGAETSVAEGTSTPLWSRRISSRRRSISLRAPWPARSSSPPMAQHDGGADTAAIGGGLSLGLLVAQ